MTLALRQSVTRSPAASPVSAGGIAGATGAQCGHHVRAQASDRGSFVYATGAANARVPFGQPSLHAGLSAAIFVARARCKQGGRIFNTRTRGRWLNDGHPSNDGACAI